MPSAQFRRGRSGRFTPLRILAAFATLIVSNAKADNLRTSWDAAALPAASILVRGRDQGAQPLIEFELPSTARVITSAGLRMYTAATGSVAQTVVVRALAASNWPATESIATPLPLLAEPLARVTVQPGARAWYEWDVGAYVASEAAAGRNTVAFAFRNEDGSAASIRFVAGAPAHRPELRYSSCTSELCKPMLGIYVGNSVPDVRAFESWLGRNVDGVLAFSGQKDWTDYQGSVGWATKLWSKLDRPIFWAIPLFPKGGTLRQAARGAYNDHYRQAAEQLANSRSPDPVLYVRPAWEWNGDWYPWSVSKSDVSNFISAWRQFVETFRSVSPRFRFDWCASMGRVPFAWEDAYPGDGYVDVIGIDVYDETIWSRISDPEARFRQLLQRDHGLDWIAAFAARTRKPISIAEWGVGGNGSGDNPVFVQRMVEWITTHSVVYHSYWNSNGDYPGQLSNGQYPRASATYRDLLGR
jgi:hypothetical protein